MRKTIPFKKEILFKTKLKEVTSISLEHDYKIDNDIIVGEFLVSGDYKITASSINRETFNYKIPFEITIDNKYDPSTITLDIENFYYEIINDEILKVNIDVFIEGDYKKEPLIEVKKEEPPQEELPEIPKEPSSKEPETSSRESSSPLAQLIPNNPTPIPEQEENTNLNQNNNINTNTNINNNSNPNPHSNSVNLFDNISMEDTYTTYYVYIVKEEDTLDTILTKYNITKEELENYNDISSLKPYDKLVIPSHNE